MGDSPEHVHRVDDACKQYFGPVTATLGGQVFTLGEISALAGDFFADIQDLAKLKQPTYATEARALLKQPQFEAEEALGQLTCVRYRHSAYLDLAIRNYTHFAMDGALSECLSLHNQAKDAKSEEDAFLCEGAALHFLVDLFSSGHIRTPRAAIERQLLSITGNANGATRPGQAKINARAAMIAGGLLAKAQHDRDNMTGLLCAFRAGDRARVSYSDRCAAEPKNWPTQPHPMDVDYYPDKTSSRVLGRFFGDGQMKPGLKRSIEQQVCAVSEDHDPVLQGKRARWHTESAIGSQILDLWPNKTSTSGRRFAGASLDYARYLTDYARPTPVAEENRPPLIKALAEPGAGSPSALVLWRSDTPSCAVFDGAVTIYLGLQDHPAHPGYSTITHVRIEVAELYRAIATVLPVALDKSIQWSFSPSVAVIHSLASRHYLINASKDLQHNAALRLATKLAPFDLCLEEDARRLVALFDDIGSIVENLQQLPQVVP